jgi:hypothetical protein
MKIVAVFPRSSRKSASEIAYRKDPIRGCEVVAVGIERLNRVRRHSVIYLNFTLSDRSTNLLFVRHRRSKIQSEVGRFTASNPLRTVRAVIHCLT